MKVKDLIKSLSVYNQDMEVKVEKGVINLATNREEFDTVNIKRVGVKVDDCVFLEVEDGC